MSRRYDVEFEFFFTWKGYSILFALDKEAVSALDLSVRSEQTFHRSSTNMTEVLADVFNVPTLTRLTNVP